MTLARRFALVATCASLALLSVAGAAAADGSKSRGKPKALGGTTTLALDPGTAAALTDAGIAVAPIGPARATSAGIVFPVTGGRLSADPLGGRIRHAGGLRLASDDAAVRLRRFVIELDSSPNLTAKVGGSRVSILDLDLSQAELSVTGRRVAASGVIATLSADGAAALNQAFGLQLEEGLTIGTADVEVRLGKASFDHDRDDDDCDDDDDDDDRDYDDRDYDDDDDD
jgi:hypothetical protein